MPALYYGNKLNKSVMNNEGRIYLKVVYIKRTSNKSVFTRNVLIAIAMCLVYLTGKYCRSAHHSFIDPPSKVKYIQTNRTDQQLKDN